MKKLYLTLLGIFIVIGAVLLISPQKTSALVGSDFNPGRIIDDAVFYNSNSITTQQIQDFLNAKVPSCDTNGLLLSSNTKPDGSHYNRAEWGALNGNPTPFTCLKDYSETVPAVVNGGSDLCTKSITAGTKTAAQIIYDSAQACGINPQVLIVLLQKEQSLVTDDWPWTVQYQKATGYGCPDSTLPISVDSNQNGCYDEFEGFFNQVYTAAKTFRKYEANSSLYNYKANRNNTIYYNPNLTGCGSSNVFIQNQATASLYIYTPYQPNQAALDNLYGTGDSCSAYGNRNFWRMFNDWFGTTIAPQYSSAPSTAYSDIPTNVMVTGDRAYITFKIRNSGNIIWNQSNTHLGTAEPYDRISNFMDNTWLNTYRTTTLQEPEVAPGDVGTFKFWYKAPEITGQYTEKFSIVLDGQAWTPYSGLYITTDVVSPNYTYSVESLGSYKDTALTAGKQTDNMAPWESAYIVVNIKNEGNRVWENSGINVTHLTTTSPDNRKSAFNHGWLSDSRVTTMKQASVAPGAIATFKFWYQAPPILGTHIEKFTLVHEGKAWSEYVGLFLKTKVSPIKSSAEPFSATSNVNTNIMRKGALALVTFKVKNTGNYTWRQANTRLGTAEPFGRISTFRYDTWPSESRTTSMEEMTVSPGQVATFKFWYQAPNNTGIYEEKFTPVIEGVSWIPYSGLYLTTNVTN